MQILIKAFSQIKLDKAKSQNKYFLNKNNNNYRELNKKEEKILEDFYNKNLREYQTKTKNNLLQFKKGPTHDQSLSLFESIHSN